MKDNWKQKYDELFRMTETYIKHLHIAEEENKALRETWEEMREFLPLYGEGRASSRICLWQS